LRKKATIVTGNKEQLSARRQPEANPKTTTLQLGKEAKIERKSSRRNLQAKEDVAVTSDNNSK